MKKTIKASWIIEQVEDGNYEIERLSDCNCGFVWGNDETGRIGLDPYQLQCNIDNQECWVVNKLSIDGIDLGEYVQYEGFNLYSDIQIIYDVMDTWGNAINCWRDIVELLGDDFDRELCVDDNEDNHTHKQRYVSSLEEFLVACVNDDKLKLYYAKGDFANTGKLLICDDIDNLPDDIDVDTDDTSEIDVDTFVEYWLDNEYAFYVG